MKYTFDIYGRPKNKALDKLMANLNKNMQSFTNDNTRVLYNAKLTTATISSKRELTTVELAKVKQALVDTFSKKFSDVSIK